MGGISLKTGSTIQAAVLDVAKIERLVELSVKPAFVDKLREETSSMETNKKVGLRFGFYFHFRILFAGCSLAFCLPLPQSSYCLLSPYTFVCGEGFWKTWHLVLCSLFHTPFAGQGLTIHL